MGHVEQIRGMAVGEQISYPIASLSSIRSAASNVGLTMGRRYNTKALPDEGVIVVTREK